jgi:hypothetical protein
MNGSPSVRVESVRRIYDDGHHDAFTDLCRFRDRFWLACRSCPDGHMVFASSKIVVLSSEDGTDWEERYAFRVPDRDTRDPHFLVFRDKLFVYTGTWLVPREGAARDLNDHLGYAAWTPDGLRWEGPRLLEGTYGHYIWRAAARGDRAYLCGRRRRNFAARLPDETASEGIEGAMLESEDGLVWRFRTLFTEEHGDETAFLFEDDGEVLAVARGAAGRPARVCRSRPPYRDWTRTALDRNIGGPLLARWGPRYLVAGRKTVSPAPACTAVYWLEGDALREAAILPSAGDNSYPGLLPLSEDRALLSYYSSHEGNASIYLADLRLD